MSLDDLRPLERTILKRTRQGMTTDEIAWRLRRSPGAVQRIIDLTKIDRDASSFDSDDGTLRPIERHVLKARADGVDTAEIASRLRRSPQFVERVEGFANHKLGGVAIVS
ncbi:MAG: hypothetical protein RIB98_01120 [Acidimicrobiales bacterium]